MTSHTAISPQEAADRLAIRELVDAYAHCADGRDARGQMELFTEDTRFLVFYDLTSEEPSQELHGRKSLAPVFDDLNQYAATMHFNGQSTISLDGDRAQGSGVFRICRFCLDACDRVKWPGCERGHATMFM
jgi:hypothetical protein